MADMIWSKEVMSDKCNYYFYFVENISNHLRYFSWQDMHEGEYFNRKQNLSIGLQADRIDQSSIFLAYRIEMHIYICVIFFSRSMGWNKAIFRKIDINQKERKKIKGKCIKSLISGLFWIQKKEASVLILVAQYSN
jgi:hypothetical protein